MGERWRLIVSGPASGARNMALDEALLDGPSDGHTLRLYWFDPPALSIGAFQPLAEVDLAACAGLGIDVVRRPTGGRAVLHDGCLTYALVGPLAGPVFRGSVQQSYGRVAAALLNACELLGLHSAVPAAATAHAPSGPSCFAGAAPHELAVAGGKIAGSAQVRRGGRALQHGSLRLAAGRYHAADLLRPRRPGAVVPADPPPLGRLLGREVSRAEAAEALIAAFAACCSARLLPGTLTAAEEAAARRLEAVRYRAATWAARH